MPEHYRLRHFFMYNKDMDDDDKKSLELLDSELAESENDGEEMLACGN